MKAIKILIKPLIVSVIICFGACKDDKLIEQQVLAGEKLSTEIFADEKDIQANQLNISDLKLRREAEYNRSKLLSDSAGSIIKESPMAAAWLHEFDKQPIEILQKYLDALTDQERDELMQTHLILLAYGAFEVNKQTIKTVKGQLHELDVKQKAEMNLISGMDLKINLIQHKIDITEDRIRSLKDRKADVTNSITELKN